MASELTRIRTKEEYDIVYANSVADPEEFWAQQAASFSWFEKWDQVLDWDFKTPEIKWYLNGKLNITVNCLDRHLVKNENKTALIWEPNNPEEVVKKYSYRQLYEAVCQFANGLKSKGIKKGDRICFYMPMVPELTIAILACARIGAVHSVVFAGFSATALADRIKDASCKMVITTVENNRGVKIIPVKAVVDEALTRGCDSVEHVIVLNHTAASVSMQKGRDILWSELIGGQVLVCAPEIMDSEDLLFILYTSGSTGKPKGVVHTCGGYMVYTAFSFLNVFQYEPEDVYWCSADIGWITGHSYIIYGPLLNGATTMMFEGMPTYPDAGRFWEVCAKHKVNVFYTAPTALRALMACGDEFVTPHDLSSLKVLGTVGEPINEEAWQWYNEVIGQNKCPIVDTWWQTETGGIMISPLAGITTPLKPSYAMKPLPGIQPVLLNTEGEELKEMEAEGLLCIKFPWPSILRTTYGDHVRCREVYFSAFENYYFTGDGCRRDALGNYRIIGRVDDVINVSGHRIGTAEVENAIDEHHQVVEAAVVGFPHEIKGQGIYAFVVTSNDINDEVAFKKGVLAVVTKEIGPIAKPDQIQIVPGLPKTRSGKIMRRILRKIASGDTSNMGDISTLLNPEIVELIKQGAV
ncbi:MAG: acetyl-CoA synthetase [Limisphaerales bacterium]|jgi:acetyl-CoA synthetase